MSYKNLYPFGWMKGGFDALNTCIYPFGNKGPHKKLNYKLDWEREIPIAQMCTGELIRENPGLEIVVCYGKEITIYSKEGKVLSHFSWVGMREHVDLAFLCDVNGDGLAEICLFQKIYPRVSRWGFFNASGKLLFQGIREGAKDGGFGPGTVVKVNGRMKLFGIMGAAYDGRPRGVVSFDILTGKEDFFYATGGQDLGIFALTDLNGDGKKEILISSSTACNGGWGEG